jgi:hypothetical protein
MAGTRGLGCFLDSLSSPLFPVRSPLRRSEPSAAADLLPAGEDFFGESPKPRQHGMSAGCRFEVLTDAIEGLFDFDVEGPRQGERIGREK